jgi:hypothetical protein
MSPTVAALAPIFALIALGFLLKTFVFRSEAFWDPIEKLTYYILFPALLVVSMAQARASLPVVVPVACILAASMLATFALLMALRPMLRMEGSTFSSVVQGSIRFNTYVGLAAVAALHGRPGTALLATLLPLMIPISNILSVVAVTRHAGAGAPSFGRTVTELAINPFILASIIGLTLNLTGTLLPPLVAPVLDALGRAALAVGLLAVGAGLNFGSLAAGQLGLVLSTVLKLIASPLLVWAGCRIVGVDPFATAIAVLFAALPPAPAAFVLARRLGGDHGLMAGIITVHTILAAVTLPLVLSLLG